MALTEEESEILDLLAEVWNKFGELSDSHDSERTDVSYHIHALQRVIASRPTWRSMIRTVQVVDDNG